ncbi:abortive infection protein [Bacteroidia bacterium]|nr:abortive infection protein [Bacteroidia bacterium]
MNKKEILDKMLNQKNGVLLTKEVVHAGISKTYFMGYVKEKELERVARGIYLSSDAWLDAFYLLQARYPEVIFSHETALYLLGMAEREPLQFTVTVKTKYHSKSMTQQNIKVYYIKKELLELGLITVESPAGHVLRAYNPERTVCDLLRNRSQVEIQDLQSALKEYTRSKDKNLPELMRYAKKLHVEKLLRQYLEVLL